MAQMPNGSCNHNKVYANIGLVFTWHTQEHSAESCVSHHTKLHSNIPLGWQVFHTLRVLSHPAEIYWEERLNSVTLLSWAQVALVALMFYMEIHTWPSCKATYLGNEPASTLGEQPLVTLKSTWPTLASIARVSIPLSCNFGNNSERKPGRILKAIPCHCDITGSCGSPSGW